MRGEQATNEPLQPWGGIHQRAGDGSMQLRRLPLHLVNSLNSLLPQQQRTIRRILQRWERYLDPTWREQHIRQPQHQHEALNIIMGVAGCGKSKLVEVVSAYVRYTSLRTRLDLQNLQTPPHGRPDRRAALTGIAATVIDAETLHHLIGLPITAPSEPQYKNEKSKIQAQMARQRRIMEMRQRLAGTYVHGVCHTYPFTYTFVRTYRNVIIHACLLICTYHVQMTTCTTHAYTSFF